MADRRLACTPLRLRVQRVMLYLVGAGGVGREALDVAVAAEIDVAAFLDDALADTMVRGLPVRRPQEALAGAGFLVAIASPTARRRLSASLEEVGLSPTTLTHPRAGVAPDVAIGRGCLLMSNCYVSSSVSLSEHVQVHYGATIGHDSTIDAWASVYPGAHVAGTVHVAAGATIGSGACVLQGLFVGDDAFVGAGAVVTHDVPVGAVVVGNPARIVQR